MTTPRERPTKGSRWFWWLWLAVAFVAELWSLLRGGLSPLTSVLTYGPLKHPWLSAALAGLLTWGGWHLFLDSSGLGWEDLAAFGSGAAILGLFGHYWRHRRDEQ